MKRRATRSLRARALMMALPGALAVLLPHPAARAQSSGGSSSAPAPSASPTDWYTLHLQDVDIAQFHPAFRSDSRGANSLDPGARGNETVTVTLFAGLRLAPGWAVYADPEIDQGYVLSNSTGVAGYVNALGTKVGAAAPYLRLQRLFTRYVWGMGGAGAAVASDQNQIAGTQQADNLVVTLGKFAVADVFDTNPYAHDPSQDFLNGAIVAGGSIDVPSDAWGYSYGGSVELNRGSRSLRGGVFNLSRVPNGTHLNRGFGEFGVMAEAEQRLTLGGQPGSVKLLGFLNRGRMADYSDATALAAATGGTPDLARVRRYRSRGGAEINAWQALNDVAGVFLRASVADGHEEAYGYTDIDRSLATGVSLQGAAWGRPLDGAGAAVVWDQISAQARAFFAAGGLGLMVGDGSLRRYGTERIVETYYAVGFLPQVTASVDNQWVVNPGYNATRGPVDIVGVRLRLAL